MKKERIALLTALAGLLFYLLPYVILQKNAYFDDHDSLDYFVAMLTAADNSGELWNLDPESMVTPILGGIPRYCFHNNLDLHMVLFTWFQPFTAFLLNILLVHVIGFTGMYLLFKKHIFPEGGSPVIISGTALLFSLLPLYPMLGISLSGIPILMYAFLNLIKNPRPTSWDYLILLFFAFYSSLVYIGIFVIIALAVVLISDWVTQKKLNIRLFSAVSLLVIAYGVFNYYLVYQVLFASDFVSNRTESISLNYNYKIVMWAMYDTFFNGHYHVHSFHFFILVIVVPLAIGYALLKKLQIKRLVLLLLLAAACAFIYGVWQWDVFAGIRENSVLLTIFKWDRFYFFYPTLWYLIFALSLGLLERVTIRSWAAGRFAVIGIIAFQAFYIIYRDKEYSQNLIGLFEKAVTLPDSFKKEILGEDHFAEYRSKTNTYNGYYQEELFTRLGEYIDEPKQNYKVAALGLHPAVLQYNGFYTIDGYLTSYPLEYKHRFKKIIEKELAKDKDMGMFFDQWGSRCYLWSAELWQGKSEIDHLELNTAQMKEMQCSYVVSSVRIKNSAENGWVLVQSFMSSANDMQIDLYRIE